MQTMKFLLLFLYSFICLLATSIDAYAQHKVVKKENTTSVDTLWNQIDKLGNKQGNWFIKSNAVMGEDNTTSYGFYNHGMKEGQWYILDEMNELLRIENYKNNLLDGENKFFEQGYLVCIGHYRSVNTKYKYDTIKVEDPISGKIKQVIVPAEKGTTKHGTWEFFDAPSGDLLKIEEWQVDDRIFVKTYDRNKEDTAFVNARIRSLPHVKNNYFKPPPHKRFLLLN